MILTVTANAALDRVIFIPEFQPTVTMRSNRVVESVGGKGFDSSVVLQHLEVPNVALGFLAGLTGQRLKQLLDWYGIHSELVWVDGDTRIAHVIAETDHHRHSHIITPGYRLDEAAIVAFNELYQTWLPRAQWVICAGSLAGGLPSSFYAAAVSLAHQRGVKALVDCPGEPARECLPYRPDILKMNRSEFRATFGGQAQAIPELEEAARVVLLQYNLPAIVITAGEDGILAVTEELSYLAACPLQQEVNAAGAGDAVSAALAWRLLQGDSWPQALLWAAATSGAVVLTEGTADCHKEDVLRLYPQCTLQVL